MEVLGVYLLLSVAFFHSKSPFLYRKKIIVHNIVLNRVESGLYSYSVILSI